MVTYSARSPTNAVGGEMNCRFPKASMPLENNFSLRKYRGSHGNLRLWRVCKSSRLFCVSGAVLVEAGSSRLYPVGVRSLPSIPLCYRIECRIARDFTYVSKIGRPSHDQ